MMMHTWRRCKSFRAEKCASDRRTGCFTRGEIRGHMTHFLQKLGLSLFSCALLKVYTFSSFMQAVMLLLASSKCNEKRTAAVTRNHGYVVKSSHALRLGPFTVQ